MTTKNFVVKNGITTGNITLDAATGNITGVGNANLGNLAVANFFSGNANALFNIQGANVVGTVGNATTAVTAGTVTTAAQPNITSVGTLTSVSVSGNADVGNVVTGGLVTATGNITGGNIITGGLITATGNANVGNIGTAGLITATGNIGGGNIVTGGVVTATGNVTAGNLSTAGVVTATGNITGGNLSTGGLVTATGNITGGNIVTGGTVSATGGATFAGNVAMTNKNITGLADPVNAQDAATKQYVDDVAQGLDPKASVVYATAAALPAYTYNNGTSGVGATITADSNGALSIDGSAVSANQRVLIKNETSSNAPYNGIYVVTNAGSAGAAFVLTRTTDFDSASPSGEIPGAFVFVESGSTNADTGWVCTTNSPVTVGTTDITFVQFSGAGTYSAGTGLTLTGTTFSVNASQTQVTSVGTLTS